MIPKKIHLTWLSGDRDKFEAVYSDFRDSWIRNNPGYEVKVWETEEIIALPEAKYFPESIELLRADIPYINKSDLARWLILWAKGGIYSDTDVICWQGFDDFLDCKHFAGISYAPNYVGNAVVGSRAKSGLMEHILRSLTVTMAQNLEEAKKRPWDFGVNPAGLLLLGGIDMLLPRQCFYPYSWEEIAYRSTIRGRGFGPECYAEHLWYGMNPDGWTEKGGR